MHLGVSIFYVPINVRTNPCLVFNSLFYVMLYVAFLVGYAPFGSMTIRETFVDVNDQTVAAPGPGQYNPLLKNLDRVKGGQSLSNTVRDLHD